MVFIISLLSLQVQILKGKDAGKQGIINDVIKERNWVVVEGLNCVSTTLINNILPNLYKQTK